jgi:hypothetical protein
MLIDAFLSVKSPNSAKDKDKTLVILRDVPQEYLGRVYEIEGDSVPYEVVLGGKEAIDWCNDPANKVKWVCSVGIVKGLATVIPPKVFEDIEQKDGSVQSIETYGRINSPIKSRVLALFKKMTFEELLRFCSLEQLCGMMTNRIADEQLTPSMNDAERQKVTDDAAKESKKKLLTYFDTRQKTLLAARLSSTLKPTLIEPSEDDVTVEVVSE